MTIFWNSLICPSCLMFGPNMGNRVCRIDEAAKKLRAKLSEARDSSKIERVGDLLVLRT